MSSIYDEEGTKHSGFATDGPFHCEDCRHLRSVKGQKLCVHPKVITDPELKWRKNDDGLIKILSPEHECCRFVKIKRENAVVKAAKQE